MLLKTIQLSLENKGCSWMMFTEYVEFLHFVFSLENNMVKYHSMSKVQKLSRTPTLTQPPIPWEHMLPEALPSFF